MDADQEKLLDELRSLVNRVDPVPEEVTKFADAALGWRRIDAELAELLSDSAVDSSITVRGGRARALTFRTSGLEIGVEIQSSDTGVTLLGQLEPAGIASITAQRDDGQDVAAADTDELGRFRLEINENGRIRLRVERDQQPPIETSWISV